MNLCKLETVCTWLDNKVRKLAIVCLPWQDWTKALVWFDDVDISAFHSCVFVDLWQSLSEWHLRGLSGKYQAIFNISRTGSVTLSQLEETFLRIREQSLSRGASQSLVGGR